MGTAESPKPAKSHWGCVPLREVIKKTQGGFACGERNPEGVIQLRMNNVDTCGRLLLEEFIRVPADTNTISRFQLQLGDVVFNNTNSTALVGKSALFHGHREPVVYSNHFTRLRTNANRLVPEFLGFWLQLQWTQKTFERLCNRWIGQSAVKPDKLLALEIPLPPVVEQMLIVAKLNEQMAGVEKARAATEAQLEAALALPTAFYRKSFNGFTPLNVRDMPRKAPSSWRWQKLTNLARLESGHTPSRNHPEWWGGSVPWLALTDIRALDGKVADTTTEYTNEFGLANSSARLLPAGTVVLSRTASVGFVSIMGRPMATSQDFVNWVCGPNLAPRFLLHLLRASRKRILELASGAIHKTVYMNIVEDFYACIPPIDEQHAIADRLENQLSAVEQLQQCLQAQLNDLKAVPAAILRCAFSGRI